MTKQTVNIDLAERSYDIHIGHGLLEKITQLSGVDLKGKKVFIITDENVAPYAQRVESHFSGVCSSVLTKVLPSGEATKSYENWITLNNWMLEHNIHRNSLVFAVGGGVIGDLTGFAASSVLRGVPFVQVPTTLLAQVDSSVGGKTGINTQYGKNLVGAFYQPISVVIDIETLKTLPRRELLAGYAEVVKYGLIWDHGFFNWLDENGADVLDLNEGALSYAIEKSCRAKADVVQADEKEGGKRALLNLGHTFGHALEAAAHYDGTLLHGEGVAIGTVMAFDLSMRLGLCAQADLDAVLAHFNKIGLPVTPKQILDAGKSLDVDALIATMRRDKKAVNDQMTFILTRGIGGAFVAQDVPEDVVREVLEDAINQVRGE